MGAFRVLVGAVVLFCAVGGQDMSGLCDCGLTPFAPDACPDDSKDSIIQDLQNDVGNLTCLVQDLADRTSSSLDIQAVISDINNLTAQLAVLETNRELLLTDVFNNIRNDILSLAGILAQLHQDSADAALVELYHQQLGTLSTILQQLQGGHSSVAQLQVQVEQLSQDLQSCNEAFASAPLSINDVWQRFDFRYDDSCNACHGARYVRSTSYTYQGKPLVVGVILCSPTRYKVLLSDDPTGTFSNIADGNGSGQDHCELVGTPNDATSIDGFFGSCSGQGFRRSHRGQDFTYGPIGSGHSAYFYGKWYECGVAIP